ncbi:MAG: TetR/AcrR family transcriptional regulator [Bacilli bacterium]
MDLIPFIIDEDKQKLTPKHKQILTAAIQLIAEKGYDNVSTAEIAQYANVAEGTIFRHYRTKKDLLFAIVQPALFRFFIPSQAKQFAQFLAQTASLEVETAIEQIIKNRYELAHSNAVFFKLIFKELISRPELFAEIQAIANEEVIPVYQTICDTWRKDGKIIDIPTSTVVQIILSNFVGFLVTRFILFPDKEWDDEQEQQVLIRSIVRSITP